MGSDPEREEPFFFTKPADAVVASGASIPYPSMSRDLHHEIELVVALSGEGVDLSPEQAGELVFGYAVGRGPDPARPPGRGQGQGPPLGHEQGLRQLRPLRRHHPDRCRRCAGRRRSASR